MWVTCPSSGATAVAWLMISNGDPMRHVSTTAVPITTTTMRNPWITSVSVTATMPPNET